MGRFGPVAILVAVIAPVSCGPAGDPIDSMATVRDSAGVTIVEHGSLDMTRELLASPAPRVEVGVVDGAEEDQLFQVADAKRLSDGGFAVANGGSQELKLFEADGTHRATAGGPGQGPNEFGYPLAIRVLGRDTVQVQDRMDRVLFTGAGEFIRRETTDRQALAALVGGPFEGGEWMSDGSLVTPVYEESSPGPPSAGPPFRPAMTLIRVSPDLSAVDTLGAFGGILQQFVDVGAEWPMPVIPPFPANTYWGLSSASADVLLADNASPELHLHGTTGQHVIVRWDSPSESISREEIEAWKEETRNASWSQNRLPQLERAWLAMDVPNSKSYYSGASTGSDGVVWLRPLEQSGDPWLVFGPDGAYLGSASLPASFQVTDSGPGWVLGVFRDELEVEFLRLYELVGP